MNVLTANEVKQIMQTKPDTVLIMVLNSAAYEKAHIPKSINIDNISIAEQQFSKDTHIIVYCSDSTCMASFQAYKQLELAGFNKIWRFAGGLREWDEMGYELIKNP